MPARSPRAGHRHAHAGLSAAARGVRRRLHLRAARRPAVGRASWSGSTTRIRCSIRTWRSTASSSIRSSPALLEGGQMVRYGAKALPEGGWNTIPQPYMDGGADRRRCGRVPQLDAPQGHSPRDAHRHARGRDGVRGGPRGRHVGGERWRAIRTRSTRARSSAELYPVRNVHQAFGYGLFAGLAFAGLSLLTRGRWLEDLHGHAGPRADEDAARGTTARARSPSPAPSNATTVDRRADVRQGDQRALLGHRARRGPAAAPAGAHRGVQLDLRSRVRPSVHALLPGERLRDRAGADGPAAADQRVELRALQDVRHHGSVRR